MEMKENISKFMLCLLQWNTIHYSGRPFSSVLKFFINLQNFINNNGIIFFPEKKPQPLLIYNTDKTLNIQTYDKTVNNQNLKHVLNSNLASHYYVRFNGRVSLIFVQ